MLIIDHMAFHNVHPNPNEYHISWVFIVTISSGFYPVAKDVHFEFQARPMELQEFLFDTRPPPPPITSTTSLIR